MKLEYIAGKQDRAIASMVKVELNEKQILLNASELQTLKEAQQICEKADQMLREHYHDEDIITDYGLADHALSDIIELGGKR